MVNKNLHLCCNQLKHRWEVRDKTERIIYFGTIKEVQRWLEENDF